MTFLEDEEDETAQLQHSPTSSKKTLSSSLSGSAFAVWVQVNLILAQILWGVLQVTNKWALDNYFTALVFASLRFTVSIPCMFLVVWKANGSLRKIIPENFNYFLQFAILGVIFGSQQSLYTIGLSYTTVSNSAVLGCITPAWTMLISLLLKRERFNLFKLFGILLCVSGALFIVDIFNLELTTGAKGDILVLINTVVFALYVVYQEYLSKKSQNSQQVLLWAVFFSAITITIFSLISNPSDWQVVPEVPFSAWASVLYAGVVATAFCYGLMGWCLKYSTPIVAMAYMPIQPITASILSFFLFSETLTLFFIIGFAVILVGLVFVIYGRYYETKMEKKLAIENENDKNNNNDYNFYLEDD